MTKDDLTRLALELPVEDQLDLAQTLWEHASPPADFSLTPELAEVLETRLREARENPEGGLSWEDVKTRIFRSA